MSLFSTSIGRKYLVGITGILLIGFLIAHLLGNLQMFLGPEAINKYAEFLKSKPALLWGARIGLLAVFIVHVATAIQLSLENTAARGSGYACDATVQATLPSRTMALTGVLVLLYVIGHLLHFTMGVLLPEYAHRVDAAGRHDVYAMVVLGFRHPLVSGLYIVAMLMLWGHLSHAVASVFQTLGLRTPATAKVIDRAGPVLSTAIVLGYISIPVAVLLGIVTLPAGGAL